MDNNQRVKNKSNWLVLAIPAGLAIAVFLLLGLGSIAGAQTQPPDRPFDGFLIEAPDSQQGEQTAPLDLDNLGPEWRSVFTENFEDANWAARWYVNADLSKNPVLGYKWGTRAVGNSLDPASAVSAWAVGGGDNGEDLNLLSPSYEAGVNSWLVAGPFNFSNAKDVVVTLDLYYEANDGDPFTVAVSEDLLNQGFVIQAEKDEDVDNGAWQPFQASLSAYAGKPTLYIAFTFNSDNGDEAKIGALMDNINIWVKGEPNQYLPMVAYGFTPTPPPVSPTPTATATPEATPTRPPGSDYFEKFSDGTAGWSARRWTFNTDYLISHDGGSDEGKSGFLNVKVNTGGSHYVIASPLVVAKSPPYNIETIVKLRSPRNTGDQYGVIFGANYNGGTCPVSDFSTCFTQYYEMRVRYYLDGDKSRMDMKLKRIDSHDGNNNNEGKDLIDWVRVSDIDEDSFVEWDITVSASGKISISADDRPVASASDSTYINNPYFGVIVRTESKGGAEAKFDHFKVD